MRFRNRSNASSLHVPHIVRIDSEQEGSLRQPDKLAKRDTKPQWESTSSELPLQNSY